MWQISFFLKPFYPILIMFYIVSYQKQNISVLPYNLALTI